MLTAVTVLQSRPLSADAFFALFRTEAAKQAAREEAEREKEAIKAGSPRSER